MNTQKEYYETQISLNEILVVFKTYRRSIIYIPIAMSLLVFIFMLFIRPEYSDVCPF